MEVTGRRLLLNELTVDNSETLDSLNLASVKAMIDRGRQIECVRCGMTHLKSEVSLGNQSERYYYCPSCLQLGRITSNQLLYLEKSNLIKVSTLNTKLNWQGKLSVEQKRVSIQIKKTMLAKEKLLVNAVTGAGKTEMLFNGIEAVLNKGGTVGLTSPRIDVCLELHPRFSEVFPNLFINLLYGGQTVPYAPSPFVICTTHQLLRFYQTFDVLIVDEADAFPLVNNPVLQHGITHSIKEKAALIYLTATPEKKLLKAVETGEIAEVVLPGRYHGFSLPLPKYIWQWEWQKTLLSQFNSTTVYTLLEQAVKNQRRLLIFCPNIIWMHHFEAILKRYFPNKIIQSVYSGDSQRNSKVLSMREGKSDWLLTTMILERGVTFSDIDVIVIGSNHKVYTEAALIQISGRVGRKASHPTGLIYFVHDGKTLAMIRCAKRIKKMNKLCSETICDDCQSWLKIYDESMVEHDSLYFYNDSMKEWFQKYKFLGDKRLASCFTKDLAAYFQDKKEWLVVPIPLDKLKFDKRGFNQVELLLESAGIVSIPLLKKRIGLEPQSVKSKKERLATKQLFELDETVVSRYKNNYSSMKIIIFDDVYTTGRTMLHAKDCLKALRPMTIKSLTLAR